MGVDRKVVHRWVQRGRQPWGYVRWQGVVRQSTVPKGHRKSLTGQQQQQLLAWRRESGFCREKLASWAHREQGLVVSIHKNFPRENAVIERSFRTDEEEFFLLLNQAPSDINQLNRWFQRYLETCNTIRPYMGLNMRRPREVVALYHKL